MSSIGPKVSPEWLIWPWIIRRNDGINEAHPAADALGKGSPLPEAPATMLSNPFACITPLPPRSTLRARITAACRRPEADCVAALLPAATLPPETSREASALAARLVTALRAKGQRGAVESLVQEYALSSQEGVALMCLAEALLRIPDAATRDALIRDKIGAGDWRRHVGHTPSLFVNAATWGLVVTGRLVATAARPASPRR